MKIQIEPVTTLCLRLGEEVLNPSLVSDRDRIAAILAKPDVVFHLASDAQHAADVAAIVEKLTPAQQADVLAADHVEETLVKQGQTKTLERIRHNMHAAHMSCP